MNLNNSIWGTDRDGIELDFMPLIYVYRSESLYFNENGTNSPDCGKISKPCHDLDVLRIHCLGMKVYTAFVDGRISFGKNSHANDIAIYRLRENKATIALEEKDSPSKYYIMECVDLDVVNIGIEIHYSKNHKFRTVFTLYGYCVFINIDFSELSQEVVRYSFLECYGGSVDISDCRMKNWKSESPFAEIQRFSSLRMFGFSVNNVKIYKRSFVTVCNSLNTRSYTGNHSNKNKKYNEDARCIHVENCSVHMFSFQSSLENEESEPLFLSVNYSTDQNGNANSNEHFHVNTEINSSEINFMSTSSTGTGGAVRCMMQNPSDIFAVELSTFSQCQQPNGRGGAIGLIITHSDEVNISFVNDHFEQNKALVGKDIFIEFFNLKNQIKKMSVHLHLNPPYFEEENSIMGIDRDSDHPILLVPYFRHNEFTSIVVSAEGDDSLCFDLSVPCESINIAMNYITPSAQATIYVQFGVIYEQVYVTQCSFKPCSQCTSSAKWRLREIDERNSKIHFNADESTQKRYITGNEESVKVNKEISGKKMEEFSNAETFPVILFNPSSAATQSNDSLLLVKQSITFEGITFKANQADESYQLKILISMLNGSCRFCECRIEKSSDDYFLGYIFLLVFDGFVEFKSFQMNDIVVQSLPFIDILGGVVSFTNSMFWDLSLKSNLLVSYSLTFIKFQNVSIRNVKLTMPLIESAGSRICEGGISSIIIQNSSISSLFCVEPRTTFFYNENQCRNLVISNTTFDNNVAEQNELGGCLFVSLRPSSKLTIMSSSFTSSRVNSMTGYGGGIYLDLYLDEPHEKKNYSNVRMPRPSCNKNTLTANPNESEDLAKFLINGTEFMQNHAKHGLDIFIRCDSLERQISYMQFNVDFLTTFTDVEHSVEGRNVGEDNVISLYWLIHLYQDERIFVGENGTDGQECGNKTNACKTMDSVLLHLKQNETNRQIIIQNSAYQTKAIMLSNVKISSQTNPEIARLDVKLANEFQAGVFQFSLISSISCVEFHILDNGKKGKFYVIESFASQLDIHSCQLVFDYSSLSIPYCHALEIYSGVVNVVKFSLHNCVIGDIPFFVRNKGIVSFTQVNVSSVCASNSSLIQFFTNVKGKKDISFSLSNSSFFNVSSLLDLPSILFSPNGVHRIKFSRVNFEKCDQTMRKGAIIEVKDDSHLVLDQCNFIGSSYPLDLLLVRHVFLREKSASSITSISNRGDFRDGACSDFSSNSFSDYEEVSASSRPFIDPVCFYSFSLIAASNSDLEVSNTKIVNSSSGGISLEGKKLSVTNCSLASNFVGNAMFPTLRQNIRCDNGGTVTINSLASGDGTLFPIEQNTRSSLSLWIFNNNCTVEGEGIGNLSSTYFIPTVFNASCAKASSYGSSLSNFHSSSAANMYEFRVNGDLFFPCGMNIALKCGNDTPDSWTNLSMHSIQSSSHFSFLFDVSELRCKLRSTMKSTTHKLAKSAKPQNLSIALLYLSSSIFPVDQAHSSVSVSASISANAFQSGYSTTPFVQVEMKHTSTLNLYALIIPLVTTVVVSAIIGIIIALCIKKRRESKETVQVVNLGANGLFEVTEVLKKDSKKLKDFSNSGFSIQNSLAEASFDSLERSNSLDSNNFGLSTKRNSSQCASAPPQKNGNERLDWMNNEIETIEKDANSLTCPDFYKASDKNFIASNEYGDTEPLLINAAEET
ncbi:uncharacterized protein MONOS_5998 [Monocercomonoides exilis]|uniref:uncharacterized protein n=1 Tax=Monocercomonoides exilis TaxID=2049356 RepID=UPI00355944D7|nr:hypothetical protein MONOS_5998 [Monocercomonoides exilis]|eukprot:MONOS_5998.1-p1 / transcript=MONOS_5998.1 / gene=MONOS_5998 / organism=Monocercomonoides_exilis_PA203 / gene_product=unspecified product / transcript_product=unspecified product / location=Mono_scaffold00182:73416-78458(-) / protein_length=1681 / sequence_SO=supercontig / SO=protein_coding / is_pseudo=false